MFDLVECVIVELLVEKVVGELLVLVEVEYLV